VDEALRTLNLTLEKRVAEQVASGMARERMLTHQARLAAMGEMIGNIAHQWRQPLGALGLVLANILDARRYGQLTDGYLDDAVAQGTRLVQQMSATISDFSDFFRPDKVLTPFSIRQQAEAAASLVDASFRHEHIALHIEGEQDLQAVGFPNEFAHVLLNLLTNAREAVHQTGRSDGLVRVRIWRDRDHGRLSVVDNGTGIHVTPIERVFEPYCSTKPGGCGLGLYMSKAMLERSMRGTLTARNLADGAEFAISIPLAGAGHDA
jgi:signal transduction histidine kinase